jgi:ATP-dependent RNA helicase HelY
MGSVVTWATPPIRVQLPRSPAHSPAPLGAFAAQYPFTLDAFQVRACQALQDGRGVLVAAPTGSGKTVVGEFAVHLALGSGRKAFYTTPIKALSNQKYTTWSAARPDAVGLLTGDNSINGDAPVVVMTTEVLRNMLYADSPALAGLGYVVMDEVHYLADRFRGAVWEEVIIHLPDDVQVVSLSATVSNAEEFGAWLDTVRGDTEVVVSEDRPVPLWQHVLVGTRLYDLFADDAPALLRGPDGTPWTPPHRPGEPGAEAARAAGEPLRAGERRRWPVAPGGGPPPRRPPAARPAARRWSTSWTPPGCCRRSRSSSAGPAARPRSGSAWPPASG